MKRFRILWENVAPISCLQNQVKTVNVTIQKLQKYIQSAPKRVQTSKHNLWLMTTATSLPLPQAGLRVNTGVIGNSWLCLLPTTKVACQGPRITF
jgi:hypothetical protein